MHRLSDRYEIIQPIGRGGVGEVYEGRQLALDRPVAIKVLRPELTRSATAVARFEREARTTCRLHHPNVVTVFDVGTSEDGRRFLIMELLKGKTLAQRLGEEPPLSYPECLSISRQIVRGMGAGQGVGLVHRDLKPENIFLVDGTHVKILDFGLATLLSQESPLVQTDGTPMEVEAVLEGDTVMLASGAAGNATDASDTFDLEQTRPTPSLDPLSSNPELGRITNRGVPMGTPRYMAPEQVLGWDIDHRSDLYSFGCILYEMLAGSPPFEGPSAKDFMRQHLHHPPASLSEVRLDLPDGMLLIVERLLRKSPSERFSDWTGLAESLRNLEVVAASPDAPAVFTQATRDRPPEPFRFLNPFTESFQCIFFGRDDDIIRFQSVWHHPDQPPMVLLTGASGVGKTSFLAARVIPALGDMGLQVLRVRGGAHPLDQLRQSVCRLLARSDSKDTDLPLPQLLDQLVDQRGRPVAVVIDQLEELFTMGDEDALADFQAGMAAVLSGGDTRIRFILSIREDFLGPLYRCLHPLPVDEISRTVPLMPLRAVDLVAALEGPGASGLPVAYPPFSFEPGLVDEIVGDLLADPSGEVAPRVQAVGARLWEMVQHDSKPVIKTHHYRAGLGGARGILARILNEAITDLSSGDRGVAKAMLSALTHLPGSPTSRPTPESELVAYAQDRDRRLSVLRRLENRWRVVQGYTDPRWPEERTYRVAHEALITQIREYGAEGTERNRARQLFHQGFHLWLKGGRKNEDLLPERHFDEVQRHIEDMVLRSADERAFNQRCLEIHNEGWMLRHLETRRAHMIRRVELTLLPSLLIVLGFILGQMPVDFISLRTARIQLLTSIGVSRLSLTGEHVPGADLSGLDLRGADLTDANLDGAQLMGADLQRAQFIRTSLERADLTGADLQGAEIHDCQLDGTRFNQADLRAASVRSPTDQADFSGALFDRQTEWIGGSPALGALGPGGRASEVEAPDAPLAGMDLTGLKAPLSNLAGSNFRGAQLRQADLTDADLSGSDLTEAQLIGTDLRRTRLTHASLADAILASAELAGADLRWANIRGTKLLRAHELFQARLDGAIADERTQWPAGMDPVALGVILIRPGGDLGDVNLAGRDLRWLVAPGISLQGADLSGANLQWADLRGADLSGADLRRADLRRARLEEANLCGARLDEALLADTLLTGANVCPTTRLPAGMDLADVR